MEALRGSVREIQAKGLGQLIPEDAERRTGINACRDAHAVWARLQEDRNGDAPVTAIGMGGGEFELVLGLPAAKWQIVIRYTGEERPFHARRLGSRGDRGKFGPMCNQA